MIGMPLPICGTTGGHQVMIVYIADTAMAGMHMQDLIQVIEDLDNENSAGHLLPHNRSYLATQLRQQLISTPPLFS